LFQQEDGSTKAFLIKQEGDSLETLAEQTGLDIEFLKSLYSQEEIEAINTAENVNIGEGLLGGYIKGINEALNEANYISCNCWGSALEYGHNKSVDPEGGIDLSTDADERLNNEFTEVDKPQIGDVIRYGKEDGYSSTDLNGDGKVDNVDEAIRISVGLPSEGSAAGGTSHMANFLLENDEGTQVFTKNGNSNKWTISYETPMTSHYGYGQRSSMSGGTAIYRSNRQ